MMLARHFARAGFLCGAALALPGCATMVAGLFDNPEREMRGAIAVQNPAHTGAVDVVPVKSQVGTVRMLSYDKKSNTLCFDVESPYALNVDWQHALAGFERPDQPYDKAAWVSEATVRKKGETQRLEAFQDKERTTVKDASGMTVATAERPVTKYETVAYGDYHVCFPKATVPAAQTKYLVLRHSIAGLFGDTSYREVWAMPE
jgi:hypothetical protein